MHSLGRQKCNIIVIKASKQQNKNNKLKIKGGINSQKGELNPILKNNILILIK